jgi:tRNA G37 N-methylase Trm5
METVTKSSGAQRMTRKKSEHTNAKTFEEEKLKEEEEEIKNHDADIKLKEQLSNEGYQLVTKKVRLAPSSFRILPK